jgi:N-acetyl-anhydromuramyl-L-alanine amidase AmpD
MAGNCSIEVCGDIFSSKDRRASSNYGIGSDGRIGMYVPEDYRAWTSSNTENDEVAVTIEVANDGGAPDWHISDKALTSLINLCVDICKRNSIEKLVYTGDKTGNLTRHNMFSNTSCPRPIFAG